MLCPHTQTHRRTNQKIRKQNDIVRKEILTKRVGGGRQQQQQKKTHQKL